MRGMLPRPGRIGPHCNRHQPAKDKATWQRNDRSPVQSAAGPSTVQDATGVLSAGTAGAPQLLSRPSSPGTGPATHQPGLSPSAHERDPLCTPPGSAAAPAPPAPDPRRAGHDETPDPLGDEMVPDSLPPPSAAPEEDILSGQRGSLAASPAASPRDDVSEEASPSRPFDPEDDPAPDSNPTALVPDAGSPQLTHGPPSPLGLGLGNTSAGPGLDDSLAPSNAPLPASPHSMETPRPTACRFASPPITLRRSRPRPEQRPIAWTLGDFLAAATGQLKAALPTPGEAPSSPHPLLLAAPRPLGHPEGGDLGAPHS
ncbi:hypothetical protein ZWY2020_045152 [Hordeum vulgare]|nr:hypothetical protein ZWY2020_045152 [Hordeum vulgare]